MCAQHHAAETRHEEPDRMEDLHAHLETMYIQAFLKRRGHTWESVRQLPAEVARPLLEQASCHASVLLAAAETRSRLLHDLHGVGDHLLD